ncbi:neuronal acetylcholine receptor subunit alpha-9-like [Amphiura filiformis]|uniref:neuronal acetylcholine receptor subunit alpha-9-like n=1 Tax=Amphiura filiformis TaxID=82378 RepID=UPI003B2254D8
MRVTANCPLDFTAFPYDVQKCNLTFGTWAYHAHDIILGPSQDEGATLDRYHENPKWKLMNTTAYFHYKNYKGAPFSEYTVILKLKRQSSQYSIKLTVPCVVTSLFVLISFLLPSAAGEKIVLNAVLLLCLIILMLYVNMALPGDAETMLGCFLSFDIFLVFFGALVSAAVYNIHYGFKTAGDDDDDKISGYYRKGIVIRVIDLIFFLIFLAVFIVGAIIILRYWY